MYVLTEKKFSLREPQISHLARESTKKVPFTVELAIPTMLLHVFWDTVIFIKEKTT